MRKLAIVLIAATMLALAANGASAEHANTVYLALIRTPAVISAGPPWCDECYRAYLPVVEVTR